MAQTETQDKVEQELTYRKIENLHIYLWLLKDLCWCLDLKTLGMVMIFPTVMGALWMLMIHRQNRVELVHNFAVCSWICANGTWMIGEFFYDDKTRGYALWFFIAGLAVLTVYYALVATNALRNRGRVSE